MPSSKPRRAPLSTAFLLLGAAGCGAPSEPLDPQTPRWHRDVAPIVIEKCSGCHRDGGIAPFALESYEQARIFADAIAESAAPEEGLPVMPPFLAQETDECQPRLPWEADLRLDEDERETLRAWARAQAPEGPRSEAHDLRTPEPVEMEREDVELRIPDPIEVQGTRDIHTCVVLDPGIERDAYVIGRLIHSGNDRILHHVVSYVIEPAGTLGGTPGTKADVEAAIMDAQGVGIDGRYECFGGPGIPDVNVELLDAWAPGGLPNLAPRGSGQAISSEALVILDMHYHPTGGDSEVDEDTYLALMLADEEPELVSRLVLLGNFDGPLSTVFGDGDLVRQPGEDEAEFRIPAGERDHVEEMTWLWRLPGLALRVYGMGTHMHYVGRDMRVTLERYAARDGEPEEECLVQTPAWDFNWQRGYTYDASMDELPILRSGDLLRFRCTFDNSLRNPFVVAALDDQDLEEPVDVELGEDTLDEMCLAAIGIVYPNVLP